MASSQPSKGKGRGRGSTQSSGPPPPSTNMSTDISTSTASATIALSSLSISPHTDVHESYVPTENLTSESDTNSSSAPPATTVTAPRGRAERLKRNVPPPDPYWTVTNLTDAQFNTSDRPKKPQQIGTLGQQIQVLVNYFPILQFPHKGLVYKYQIQIRNKKDLELHRDRRRLLYNSWLKAFSRRYPQIDRHKIVFDNQLRIITFDEPLPDIDEEGVSEVIMGPNRSNRQEPYSVTIQLVGRPVDLSLIRSLPVVCDRQNESNDRMEDLEDVKQVLSIALHEHCSSHAEFVYNRCFFTSPVEGQRGNWDLGLGKALWRGFYSCLVFAKGTYQLLMNLDVKYSVFMKKQPFLDFLCEIMLHSPSGKKTYGRQRNISKANGDDVLRFLDVNSPTYRTEADFLLKHCKHLRVRSQDVNKPIVYEILKLGLPASQQQFLWKVKNSTPRMITVQNYYKEHYGIELQHPTLPLLEMRQNSYLPMELVDVEPVKIKKISDDQRALMCRYSTVKPVDYSKSIQDIRKNPKQQCFEQDPFVTAWNLNVDVKMITLPARVLPMPEIVYTDQFRVVPNEIRDVGAWEIRTTRFHKPSDFPRIWAMINLSSLYRQACEEFYYELSVVAEQRGMKCSPPEIYEERNGEQYSIEQIIAVLKDLMKKNDDCKFFLVILPPKSHYSNKAAYKNLKGLCELENGLGIVTQMIEQKNAMIGTKKDLRIWDKAKLSNILLKINTKLNGTNSVLKVHDVVDRFFSRGHRIMYVGADLSHPAPGAVSQPSLVAVVASADDIPNRYFKEIYQQHRPPQARGESREYIVDMRKIMKSLIRQYADHRGYPPTAIMFYRDGISESEFDSVFEKELTGIRQACADLSPVYRPCITYIVVSKRHHTRLFPTNTDKNVPAGTVVVSADITHATTYDFYLNSHHDPLGTSRPTHYYVLYDDNKLKPDEVQMLTYALCYTYARCTRSVSIPAPVKYADLLALRASFYVKPDDQSDTESIMSEPRIPVNQDVDIKNTITSERIVLSAKIAPDCPFFL